MGVTHIIGATTFEQLPEPDPHLRALGLPLPGLRPRAHDPGAGQKKLSKRTGATSVLEYLRQASCPGHGERPGAPGMGLRDQEIFSRERLQRVFSTDKRGSSGRGLRPDTAFCV
jgi:hypothetical protein